MVDIRLTLSEKQTKAIIVDIVPKIMNEKKSGHELVIETGTSKGLKDKISFKKQGNKILLKGAVSEIELNQADQKKLKSLL